MKNTLFTTLLFSTNFLFAQNYKVSDYDPSANPGQVIKEIKLPPPKTEGNVYLDDDWHLGSFKMKGAPLYEGFLLRYDLQHQNLEIRVKEEIKVCVLSMLDEFYFIDKSTNQYQHFLNIKAINDAYIIGHKGVVEILIDDKAPLYKQFYLVTQKANYSPTTDTGSKDNKIIKKSSYYLASNGQLVKFYQSLKKNKKALGNEYELLETYEKEHKLKLKNEKDMISLVTYYNLLLSK